jgi:hypothetical protein
MTIAKLTQALACLALAGSWAALWLDPRVVLPTNDPRSLDGGEQFAVNLFVGLPGVLLTACAFAVIICAVIDRFDRGAAGGVLTLSAFSAVFLGWYYWSLTSAGTPIEKEFWRPVTLICAALALVLFSMRAWRRSNGVAATDQADARCGRAGP